jgi:hypothetical protein
MLVRNPSRSDRGRRSTARRKARQMRAMLTMIWKTDPARYFAEKFSESDVLRQWELMGPLLRQCVVELYGGVPCRSAA